MLFVDKDIFLGPGGTGAEALDLNDKGRNRALPTYGFLTAALRAEDPILGLVRRKVPAFGTFSEVDDDVAGIRAVPLYALLTDGAGAEECVLELERCLRPEGSVLVGVDDDGALGRAVAM